MNEFSQLHRQTASYCAGSSDWYDVLWLVIIVAALVTMVIFVVRYMNASHAKADIDSDVKAVEIARERYAKGEITKDEFIEIHTQLTKK